MARSTDVPAPHHHRAEKLEAEVAKRLGAWFADPDAITAHIAERLEQARSRLLAGDPERQVKARSDRLSKIGKMRENYRLQHAEDLMTIDELRAKLLDLDEQETAVKRELDRTLAVRPTDFGALRRRRRRGVLTILAALALAGCVAWAAIALPGTNTKSSVPRVTETAAEPPEAPKATSLQNGAARQVTIPNVSGQTLEEAVKTISGAGFQVATIETRTNPQTPETAIRTNPAAGATARQGAPVTLTLSAGPANTASPTRPTH